MNSSRQLFTSIRTYATKSKTTNLKYKSSVPVEYTTLSDGSIFIERQPVVHPSIQSQTAPLLRKTAPKSKLTDSQISELRQLRESDPTTWTRSKLAKKYNCSELFVGMVAPLKETPVVQEQANHGYRRQLITEQRQKRRALW
ncbi:mitochondrial ribosomal protein subunit L20-domain-containing protein [Blakeslea trispora]|nr:mitochondrial ribosomal protein subunit L20-domain-containing protein [Blakeslea trispora]